MIYLNQIVDIVTIKKNYGSDRMLKLLTTFRVVYETRKCNCKRTEQL